MSVSAVAALLSGGLTIAGTIPYVRHVLRGMTQPHRATWPIWSVLAAIASCSQLANGARWSLVLTGTVTATVLVVFVLAVPRGFVGVSRLDLAMLAGAGISIIAW